MHKVYAMNVWAKRLPEMIDKVRELSDEQAESKKPKCLIEDVHKLNKILYKK